MKETTVEIIIQGLIALIPIIGVGGGMEMQMLAVNGKHALGEHKTAYSSSPLYGQCMNEHAAEIEIEGVSEASSESCDDKYRCRPRGEKACRCSLEGREIVLESEKRSGAAMNIVRRPVRALPFSGGISEEESLSYVPSLPALGADLKMGVLGKKPPEIVSSRFRFSYDWIRACDFAWRREGLADHVHAFSFRKIGSKEKSSDPLQAGAQTVRAGLYTAPNEAVAVILRDFDGGNPVRFDLEATAKKPAVLKIMNHRVVKGCTGSTCPQHEDMPFGHPCDDGIGRDFALFYELAQQVPSIGKRPIPHLRHSISVDIKSVSAEKCSPDDRAATSRPVCFMARFDPVREEDLPQ